MILGSQEREGSSAPSIELCLWCFLFYVKETEPVLFAAGGGVVLRDEIFPDGHESFVEVGPLVGRWSAEERRYVEVIVDAMPGADNRVLIFISYAMIVREGFGQPV